LPPNAGKGRGGGAIRGQRWERLRHHAGTESLAIPKGGVSQRTIKKRRKYVSPGEPRRSESFNSQSGKKGGILEKQKKKVPYRMGGWAGRREMLTPEGEDFRVHLVEGGLFDGAEEKKGGGDREGGSLPKGGGSHTLTEGEEEKKGGLQLSGLRKGLYNRERCPPYAEGREKGPDLQKRRGREGLAINCRG